MYLIRDRLVLKQISVNRKHENWAPLAAQKLNQLSVKAHEQLSLNKTVNRQIEYFRIELFLELATSAQRTAFYNKLKHDLNALFGSQRAQKTFQSKWTLTLRSNVLACFSRIARDFFKANREESIRNDLTTLYVETIDKLLSQEKMSKIQQKFLEPFLVQCVKLKCRLDALLGNINYERLRKTALTLSKNLAQRQTPKTLTSNHFLKYCAMRCLQVPLPHQKYLYNQLLHAPNPKYLLPFRCKGTFFALTNQLLLKSNKLDMVGCLFWNYYEYEDGDLFERLRRAAEWGGRVDILVMLIGPKIVVGLQRCLNLINEKVIHLSSKNITDQDINCLMALVETGLYIFKNNSKSEHMFESSLQKLDIRQVFQQPILQKESRLRVFASSLLELYFKMIESSCKKQLKLQSLSSLGCQLTRLLQCHMQTKFTKQITAVTLSSLATLTAEERTKFIFGVVQTANQDWQSSQYEALGNQIATINIHAVRMLASVVAKYGFEDQGKADYKMVKLNFYYILSLNFKESDYFQSKQKLSRTILDINPSLTNNTVFRVLQTRKLCYEAFITHLASLYGSQVQNLGKLEYEGILAAIDELVTYRIQQTKVLVQEKVQIGSFYSLLVSFLQQVERIEPQGKMFKLVKEYFLKCKKTYLIQVFTIKGRDDGRTNARILITKDVMYLLEGCVSANPKISSFCWEILLEYIQRVPELAIYTQVLAVWAECLSVLYRKSNQQYDSKSQKLKVKSCSLGILIPTERKQILSRMKILMCGLYGVIWRGHMIDNDYLNVRVQYLIRQTCKSASFGFGWKLLKHLTNSFKDDKEFIAKEVLVNNSCSWFVNDDYFNSRLAKVKPQRILLDKYLIPLHEGEVDNDQLKKIFLAVQPQVETEFVTIPPQSSQTQIKKLVIELSKLCTEIDQMQQYQRQDEQQLLQSLYSSLFDVISRVKMIYITKWNQAVVFSQILDVCRVFTNFRLLQHTLLKIVPFFYCLNQFNRKIVQTLAELLHFVVSQLNISCLRNTDSHQSDNNTFDPRLNQFIVLPQYQAKQMNIPGKRHKAQTFHQRRVSNLKLMYGQLVKFFSSHMHVCIAKGFELSLLLRVFSINFLVQRNILPQLPLQSVCRCLLSQLQLVNVLRSALQRGETAFDGTVVDNFYVKTIKSALYHFQKQDFSVDEQSSSVFHNKQLKQRIDFLIQICDYLRNDDFHQLSKKKLPKRNQIFARRQSDMGLDLSLLKRNRSSVRGNTELMYASRRPVSSVNNQQANLTALRYSLLYFISQQIDRTKAYAFPQLSQTANPYSLAGKKGFINNSILEQLLSFLTPSKGAILIYNMLSIFGDRIQHPTQLYKEISKILSDQPIYNYPSFLPFYVHQHKHTPEKLRELNYWRSPHIPVLLKYLSKDYQHMPALQKYVTKVLKQLEADQILFYLPQIFQALTLKSGKIIAHFLLQYARKSSCFAHQLIWLAKVQSKQEKDPHNKSPRVPQVDLHLTKLLRAAKRIIRKTLWQFSRQEKQFFYQVNDFYQQVTAISGKMKAAMPAPEKKEVIDQEVAKIVPPKSAYLPFNPTFQVLQISKRSGTPMQSAAKCPFLLTFHCIRYEGPDQYFAQQKVKKILSKFREEPEDDLPQEQSVKPMNSMLINGSRLKIAFPPSFSSKNQFAREHSVASSSQQRIKKSELREISCIFKVFDDIRQDCLALQVIRLFLQIFQRHKLDLKLFPYHTLSNRTGSNLDIGGIIQVVPNCLSRDSIGKTNEQSLYEFFLNNFGAEHNPNFQSARQNFIRSQAAYSIVSYILQVKDRHNGNILIDKEQGYLVHIDFGFILEISPAGNLRFERAAFKLTQEMIKIMGGSIQSQPFQLYLTLVIKGFLVARRYHKHVVNLVKLMILSGLPCFLPKALQNLQNRFFLELSEIEAAQRMKDIVLSAADHWTTNWYDRIQWMQQKIYH